jgi:ABC-2 type transport system permease protein
MSEAVPSEALVVDEPSALNSLWASIRAVVGKETRWRMRGRRAFAVVTIYVALSGLLVFAVYDLLYQGAVNRFGPNGEFIAGNAVSGQASTAIGQGIFGAILVIQTLLILMVAPALTSGAISTEREKQTLELLISTPVSTLGMVIGKLISSLAFALLLVAASVPLMSVVFVFGGVAPEDVVRAYVMLFAVALGVGSMGLFMSALLRRTQVSTAVSYLIVLLLTVGSVILYAYLSATAVQRDQFGAQRFPAEQILWLNPFVADLDVICTATPESGSFTCAGISGITGQQFDPTKPPRDAYWPRSAAAFLILGAGLTVATTQLIVPSRRIRRRRDEDEVDAAPRADVEALAP